MCRLWLALLVGRAVSPSRARVLNFALLQRPQQLPSSGRDPTPPLKSARAVPACGFRAISVASLRASDAFEPRHNSNSKEKDIQDMLSVVGFPSIDALIDATVPKDIVREPMRMKFADEPMTETEFLSHMKSLADKNVVNKSFIGMGYHGTITPSVILRNLIENPGWYTQYTPYQAEISQGRLESLLNFQSMIVDLTGMPMCNASLLDEATGESRP